MSQDDRQFDQSRGDVFLAIALYPLTVVFFTVLLAAAGVFLGYSRDPTYTASSELLVGNLSISDPSAIPGAVGASQSLAAVYARLINANDVRQTVASATQDSPDDASLGASPVVESPLVRVRATSDSEEGAVAYTNAGAKALSSYVNNLRSPGSDVGPIAKRYREAALVYSERLKVLRDLKDRAGSSVSSSEQVALNEAEAELQTAKLKRTALGAIFQRGQNIRVAQPSLNVFVTADSASSNRASTMQITGGIGLVAGLALGIAVAMLRTARMARRQAG